MGLGSRARLQAFATVVTRCQSLTNSALNHFVQHSGRRVSALRRAQNPLPHPPFLAPPPHGEEEEVSVLLLPILSPSLVFLLVVAFFVALAQPASAASSSGLAFPTRTPPRFRQMDLLWWEKTPQTLQRRSAGRAPTV